MSLASQIFGLASTTAYIAGTNAGLVNISGMLQQMAVAFGGQISDGTYVFNLCLGTSGLMTTQGFDNASASWSNLTGNVGAYESFLPSNIGISSLIYAFGTYSNLQPQYQANYINTFNKLIYHFTFGPTINPAVNFNSQIINSLLNEFQITSLNTLIGGSPSNSYNKMVNYNWYDTTPFFATSNFADQLIKDVENQYYYLTGEIYYDGLPTGLTPCINVPVNINTSTGIVQISYISNTPCYNPNSYIGPISGVRFSRVFSDGPPTSGYFDSAVMAEYQNLDEFVLNPADFLSNNVILYTYIKDSDGNYRDLYYTGVNIDVPGVYNPNAEYGFGKTNYISNDELCEWGDPPIYEAIDGTPLPYMNMHEGDNALKLWLYKYCAIPVPPHGCEACAISITYNNWTGWKLVDFELDSALQNEFFLLQTNPQVNSERLLKRVLNIDPNGPYLNAIDTGDGILSCSHYVGPPQLNGNSSMPGFVFYQTFDNRNFPDGGIFASIVVRPAISVSSQGAPYALSDREFNNNISNFNILSGSFYAHPNLGDHVIIPFHQVYDSTQMFNYDDIFKQCLTIGDNFGNLVTSSATLESNAGFYYTGYAITYSGIPVTQNQLFKNYPINVVGANHSIVKFITGYQNINGKTYSIVPQVAQIISGDTSTGIQTTGQAIDYYYFDTDSNLGSTNIEWTTFAPIPSDVVNHADNYSGLYGYQTVENYLPRYSMGPFLSYDTTFLYPNAQSISQTYSAQTGGFPTGFAYILNVREETVKEAYTTSGFNNYLIPIQVIRAVSGAPFDLGTAMETPFTANNSIYHYTYNFNANPKLYSLSGGFTHSTQFANCVRGDYVPSINGCQQMSLNSAIMDDSFGIFDCGVRITGQFIDRVIYTGINGASTYTYSSQPLINGLYWGYRGYQRSGVLAYIPPVFDLSTQSFNVTPAMSGAFFYDNNTQMNKLGTTTSAFSNNGSMRYIDLIDPNNHNRYNGKDPISYQYIGGRIGPTASGDGGYNDLGIIGDSWYDFTIDSWGQSPHDCDETPYLYRSPENDENFVLLGFNSGAMNIYTRGLQYNPYYLNWKYVPYPSPQLSIGIPVTPIKFGNEYYFRFNLKNILPIISITGSGLYSSAGYNIGPFPMDSELCITGKDSIIPSGDLYINGELIATSNFNTNNFNHCVINPVDGFLLNSGVILNQGGRSSVLSTFKLVPSGGYVNINISGTGKTYIGFAKDAIVTIRPRTVFGQIANQTHSLVSLDTTLLSGDLSIMNNFQYINNGSESMYSIPNNGRCENLVGKTFVFETMVNSEVLFPVPDSDFISVLSSRGLVSTDAFGNYTYDLTNGGPTYQYWNIKSPNTYFTGFREISRISFEVVQMIPQYGPIPYMGCHTMVPSGNCTISGAFGYSGEAASAVISKGIILSGKTFPSLMSGIIQPTYVSDVLQRLPTGIYVLPSGSGIYLVQSAPSYVADRLNYAVITGNDTYVYLTPTGTNYNRFLWPALSDFAMFNNTLTYEAIPPDDGTVFLTNTLNFSASQGQQTISGHFNPIENATYQVIDEFMFLDSIATNALYNTGECLLNQLPAQIYLDSGKLSGILAPEGATLSLALAI